MQEKNQSNDNAGTKACDNAGKARMETIPGKDYILLPLWPADLPLSQNSMSSPDAGFKPSRDNEKKVTKEQGKEDNDVEDVGAEANINNLNTFMPDSPILTTRIHKDYPIEQIIGDLNLAPQTRRMIKNLEEHGKIEEEVYVCQSPGFEDPDFPDRVYKVEKALYGLHQAPRAWYETLSTYLLDNGFQRGKIDKTLFIRRASYMVELIFFLGLKVKQKEDGIFISQDKYVTEILKKFGFIDVKTASTPMETQKALLKDEDGEEVDVHLYRSMIGSLMYLTSSRSDIMFAVCACARYQVNQKMSHLHAVKRISWYLKGQPKLGLWYPKDLPFDLVAYTDSDYAGASLDRKSTTGGSNIGAFKLSVAHCALDSKSIDLNMVNFMHQSLFVMWRSTILQFFKNPVFYSKTKHIEIRHHFIRDSNEKKLIQMIKIHTDKNVADLLTKAFNVKMVNGEQQLQALVDGKKIITTEAIVRRDLQLEDANGVNCLPNAIIFEQLTLMGANTTAWNEFSSTMASTIICLATNQKFNFSKYIFESMVKNLDNAGKFLMYPRFVQVFLDNQLEGMINHNRIYISPSRTKKVFANMKRQGKDFSGRVTPLFSTMMVKAQQEHGEGSDMPTDPHHTPTIIPPLTTQPQRKQRPRKPNRKDTEIPQSSVYVENVANKAIYKGRDDSLERATTTATGLDAEQDRGNISKTQSKATPNEPSSIGTSSGGGLRRQDTIGDTIAQTRSENVSKFSNDPLLAGVNTPRSAQEITSLKKRVKKLERKKKSRAHGLKRLYKVGLSARIDSFENEASLGDQEDASKQGRKIHDIDADEDFTLENVHDANMFGVHDLDSDEVFVETEEPVVNAATTTSTIPVSAAKDLSDVDMTLAQALGELKSTKPKVVITTTTTTTTTVTRAKAKGLVIQEQEQASTLITSSNDKGKGIMVEEPLKMKKKDQVLFDEQEVIRIQAQFDEEE
ncbi:putative ribonuclease H-like domain-containing protein [Tanacetum coccineum]